MDQTLLVGPNLAAGRDLVQYLDTTEFAVHSALWLFLPETAEWRLVIASPFVEKRGPTAAYRFLQAALKKTRGEARDLRVSDITAISPSDPLIRTLSTAMTTGPGIAGIRFSRNVVNGAFIEDAYIYRLQSATEKLPRPKARSRQD